MLKIYPTKVDSTTGRIMERKWRKSMAISTLDLVSDCCVELCLALFVYDYCMSI